jgi:polysaccharide biosynthesis/export protein
MTLYANRSNVLVMREENGERKFELLNLNSNEVFNSPYFYLKPNDIVYVKPSKARLANTNYTSSTIRQWLPILFSALSLGTLVIYRLGQ